MLDDKQPDLSPDVDVQPERTTSKAVWKEILQFALIAVFIVLPFRIFVAQPFVVNGASMDPTFHNGEYLIVDQLTYRLDDPDRGDVVIFKFPEDESKFFIKRVIGLPGETVAVNDGIVTIINSDSPDGFTLSEPFIEFTKTEDFSSTLGDSEYFVMGDNRGNSSDSRVWGSLPEENIIGRPILRLLPVRELDLLPGIINYDL